MLERLSNLVRSLREARAQSGKGIADQLFEIWQLRRRATMFGVADYFDYRLFDDVAYAGRDKAEIAGWRMLHWLADGMNRRWHATVADKLIVYTMLRALGLPYPKIHAVYRPVGQRFPGSPTFRTLESLAEFIRDALPYPCFAKPSHGDMGYGAVGIHAYDKSGDQFVLTNGRCIAVGDFVGGLHDPRPGVARDSGYIFAEYLQQHPRIQTICGDAISCARVVVLMYDDGPVPFRAVWKIAKGGNMTDHFFAGRSGNLLAAIDLETGEVLRVINGTGLAQRTVTNHPDSGAEFAGLRMPHWQEAVALCRNAALAFPDFRLQHWDVAFTASGPVLMEVNSKGSIDFLQWPHYRGLYDRQLQDFVRKYMEPAS